MKIKRNNLKLEAPSYNIIYKHYVVDKIFFRLSGEMGIAATAGIRGYGHVVF